MPAKKALILFLFSVTTLFLISCGGGGGGSTTTPPASNLNPVPQVSGLSPASVIAGSGAATLTINGSGFMSGSTVQWGATTRSSTYVSATQLQLSLTDADVAAGGTVQVKVSNSSPGGGSASATFTINNPQPVVSSVSPTTATAGQTPYTVTVTGTGFVASSVVNVNGNSRATTFVSATQLQATMQAADCAVAGALQITVSNGTPGGGTSSATPATTISVSNPSPLLQSIAPTTLNAGSSSGTVTLTGSGFISNSTVQVNGAQRSVTYVSGTQLKVTVSAADLAGTGTLQIAVVNAAPGGGTSAALPLSVIYPVPAITGLTPGYVAVGAQGLTLTIQGSGFFPVSTVQWNGSAKTVQFVSSAMLKIYVAAADLSTAGAAQVTVTNPTPGGGTSQPAIFNIDKAVISTVYSSTLYVGSSDTTLDIYGGGFEAGSTVHWNGTALTTTYQNNSHIEAILPAAFMASLGSGQLVVVNPDSSATDPFALSVVANPVPVLSSIYPASKPVGSPETTVSLNGSGFTNASVAAWNGTPIATSFNGYQLVARISAAMLQKPGSFNITVTNPGPGGGGTTAPVAFSTFLPIAANDLVYSAWSKLLYASVPSTAGSLGNSIAAIDPTTGNVMGSVFVGSEPNKMAISSDGKVLWVGIDGAGTVRKVDLTTMTASTQFSLGGGPGVYNPPFVALDLAVVPGSPDAVAVYTQGFPNATVKIYDSGVMRQNYFTGGGFLAFNTSGAKLYTIASTSGWGGGYNVLNIDATGVSSSSALGSNGTSNGLRYDNGHIYTTSGTILMADTGALLATLYSSANTVAYGPVAPDSTLGKAFVLLGSYSSQSQVLAFDTNTYVTTGSTAIAGLDYYSSPTSLVRWGQNGLAFRIKTQIFILQSNIVKDMSATPANLSVTMTAPAAAGTGSNLTYTAKVANKGPNTADEVVLFDTMPAGATVVSATTAQGTCVAGAVTRCNLGTILNGANVQVQFTITPNTAGTFTQSATVSATEPDPDLSDNTASASVAVTGNDYNPSPIVYGITPQLVQAGSGTFIVTVTGSGFVSADTVMWNGNSLPTTFVSSSSLNATVDSAKIASLGYAWVSVSSPEPGGGSSASVPLTVYNVIALDTNQIAFEPFQRKIFATVPSTAKQVVGNSLVVIDPVAGTTSSPINIGSQPTQLAFSDDGNYLFVALDGANSISRFNLKSNASDLTFALGKSSYGDVLKPRTLAVAPGNSNLLAVDTSSWNGIALYDISGSSATMRTRLTGPYTGSYVAFGDSTHVYSYDSDTTGAEFYRWTVLPDGLTQLDGTTLNGMGGFSGGFKLSKGLVFGSSGGVANPNTTPPSMLGKFAATGSVAPDAWIGREFFVGCATDSYGYCSANNTLLAFDQATFRHTNAVPLPISSATNLIRWGSDGLAFQNPYASAGSTGGQVYILRGPLVVPQLGVANAVPSPSSVSPNNITAGSGNQYLTIVGSGFVPGAVAKWNNMDRTTYVVDSTHLSVAIPSSDLATAGTANVTVLNPGAPSASSALSVTIQ